MKNRFRVLVSVILILSMAAALLLPVRAKADDSELSVFVASDIHYKPQNSLTPITQVNNLPGDEMYSHVNTKSMLTYEADAILDAFLTRFEASDAEYLLIPGDLSEDGYWDEHLGIAQKLREFKERTGKKIFLIPGNHDIRTSNSQGRLNLSDFLEVYADIGFDETLAAHDGSASYTAELNGNYRLLAIDACIYRQDGSAVSDDLFSWIEKQVNAAKRDGKKLIGMAHHNLLKHFAVESIGGNLLCLEDYKALATQFADWGVKYFFTGHEHANDISAAVSRNGNRIFDIETGSLITYPNAYREVRFSDQSVDIQTKYIDKINVSLLPEGYTDKQLKLLNEDFPAYSYAYFRAGFKSYAYAIPELTDKLAGNLKIEQGTAAYEAVSDVVDLLFDAANMPLYDRAGTPKADSVEEIARKQGVELEESAYDNVLDVAAAVYAGHYAGDENMENTLEMRLLGQGLKAVLTYAFLNVPTVAANTVFKVIGLPETGFTILDHFYGAPGKQSYIKSAVDIILGNMIEPLLGGIINDVSVPGDLNETLEPYGASFASGGQTVPITTIGSILDMFIKIFTAVVKCVKHLTVPWFA